VASCEGRSGDFDSRQYQVGINRFQNARDKTTRARKTAGYKNRRCRLEFTSLIRSLRKFRYGGGDESVTPIDETLRGLQGAFKILSQPKLITAGKTVMLSLRQCIYIIYKWMFFECSTRRIAFFLHSGENCADGTPWVLSAIINLFSDLEKLFRGGFETMDLRGSRKLIPAHFLKIFALINTNILKLPLYIQEYLRLLKLNFQSRPTKSSFREINWKENTFQIRQSLLLTTDSEVRIFKLLTHFIHSIF